MQISAMMAAIGYHGYGKIDGLLRHCHGCGRKLSLQGMSDDKKKSTAHLLGFSLLYIKMNIDGHAASGDLANVNYCFL